MSFAHLTPEQRKAAQEKSAATRKANKIKRMTAAVQAAAPPPLPFEEISLPQQSAYGSAAEKAEDDILLANDSPADPFRLFLLTLDAETRELIDQDELRRIYDEQAAKATLERKNAKKKLATELALSSARASNGLVPAATTEMLAVAKRNSEMVRMKVDMPPCGANGEVSDIGLRINGVIYEHGKTYTITRGEADSWKEILYRTAEMEMAFQGQKTNQRRWILSRAMGQVDRHIMLNEDGTLA